MDAFLSLEASSNEEMARRLEPVFCKAFSERVKLSKACSDFTRLCCELPTPPARLLVLASRYESLQYSKQGGPEVAMLYQECSELLNDYLGKEPES